MRLSFDLGVAALVNAAFPYVIALDSTMIAGLQYTTGLVTVKAGLGWEIQINGVTVGAGVGTGAPQSATINLLPGTIGSPVTAALIVGGKTVATQSVTVTAPTIWLDSLYGLTPRIDGPTVYVESRADQSGTGIGNITQANTSQQPVFDGSEDVYDGVDDRMQTYGSLSVLRFLHTSFTAGVVVNLISVPSTRYIWDTALANPSTVGSFIYTAASLGINAAVQNGSVSILAIAPGGTLSIGLNRIILSFDATNGLTLYANGSLITNTPIGAFVPASGSDPVSQLGLSDGTRLNAGYRAFVAHNSVLGATDLARFDDFLASRLP